MATKLITPSEAAARFGIHPASIRRWAASGLIPSVRTPTGRVLVPSDLIEKLAVPTVQTQRVEPAAA